MADINITLIIDDGLDASFQVGTASTPPGGSDKEIQFNDGGVFGGASLLTWNKTTSRLDLGTSAIVLSVKGKIFTGITDNGNKNGAFSCDLSLNNDHIVTANGNLTLGHTNMVTGQSGIIVLKMDNIGGYAVSLDGSFTTELNGSDTIDTVANKKNLISYWYDGTFVYYSITNEA